MWNDAFNSLLLFAALAPPSFAREPNNQGLDIDLDVLEAKTRESAATFSFHGAEKSAEPEPEERDGQVGLPFTNNSLCK